MLPIPQIHRLQQFIEASLGDDPSEGSLGWKPSGKRRIFVCAESLPVRVVPVTPPAGSDGPRWKLEERWGGALAVLMDGNRRFGQENFITWVGCAGREVPPSDRDSLTALLAERSCLPVFLDRATFDDGFTGYANDVLNALFHYISRTGHATSAVNGVPDRDNSEMQWAAYQRANQAFVNTLCDVVRYCLPLPLCLPCTKPSLCKPPL